MEKLFLKQIGMTFMKNNEGGWQYETASGLMCGCNIHKYIRLEKLLRAFSKAPKLVFEIMTEGFRGQVRRVGLSDWEADFSERMVKRQRPYTEKQKEIMAGIISKMMEIKTDTTITTLELFFPELVGSTKKKRLLSWAFPVEDIRKFNDDQIKELEKFWKEEENEKIKI